MPTLECSIDSRVVIALINSVQGAGVVFSVKERRSDRRSNKGANWYGV